MNLILRIGANLILLSSSLTLAACTTLQAGSDHYTGADFSAYHSFAWISEMPMIRSESLSVEIDPLSVRNIREAIERELRAKGYALVPAGADADFAVSFTVGARDMIRIDDYPALYRGGWRWGSPYYWPNVDVYMYTEGMLAIDVFDNASREPVWHGWARKRIVGSDIEEPVPAINAAVAAILERFPP